MSEEDVFGISAPKQNTRYKIADNVSIDCIVKLNWFNRLMIRLVFGWKVEEL